MIRKKDIEQVITLYFRKDDPAIEFSFVSSEGSALFYQFGLDDCLTRIKKIREEKTN